MGNQGMHKADKIPFNRGKRRDTGFDIVMHRKELYGLTQWNM
jgi:hypothetical protein